MAVFQDDLIRSYRAFSTSGGPARPRPKNTASPADQEMAEFRKHFQVRKVALGTAAALRASCQHEHALPSMRNAPVSPHNGPALPRSSATCTRRITEARMNGWLGESRP